MGSRHRSKPENHPLWHSDAGRLVMAPRLKPLHSRDGQDREEQELTELPRSVVVVGGGYIALELSQMFRRFGTEVTILERSEGLLPQAEPEVGPTIASVLEEEGIQVLRAEVRAVRQESGAVLVIATVAGREQTLRAERLLVATGRRPNTDGSGLENAGVETDRDGWVVVDPTFRTSAP